MSDTLEEFKRKVTSLQKEAEELQRFRSDIDMLRKLHKKIVRSGYD